MQCSVVGFSNTSRSSAAHSGSMHATAPSRPQMGSTHNHSNCDVHSPPPKPSTTLHPLTHPPPTHRGRYQYHPEILHQPTRATPPTPLTQPTQAAPSPTPPPAPNATLHPPEVLHPKVLHQPCALRALAAARSPQHKHDPVPGRVVTSLGGGRGRRRRQPRRHLLQAGWVLGRRVRARIWLLARQISTSPSQGARGWATSTAALGPTAGVGCSLYSRGGCVPESAHLRVSGSGGAARAGRLCHSHQSSCRKA